MSDEPLVEAEEEFNVPAQQLTVYVVRNSEGKFFRAKGYGGYGNSWVDDIQKARIYARIGPARSAVTYWSKRSDAAQYGVPEILVISGEVVEVLKEDDRVQKSKEAKKKRRDNSQRRHLERQRADLERRLRELG